MGIGTKDDLKRIILFFVCAGGPPVALSVGCSSWRLLSDQRGYR